MNEKATQFANEAIAQTENTAATCVSMMRRALEINDVGLACHAAAELVNAVGDAFMFDALADGFMPNKPRDIQLFVRDALREMAPDEIDTTQIWNIVHKMNKMTIASVATH